MSVDFMGGDPRTPDYYIHVRCIEIRNSFLKRMFTQQKTRTEEIVSIITSSDYDSLSKGESSLYKGMTIADVHKYGTKELKKQLPKAEARSLGKIIGIHF